MFEIRRRFTISAAHFMSGDDGPCGRLHGHNFEITVAFRGEPDPSTGMIFNALAVNEPIAGFKNRYDHSLLNESMEGATPTIELLAELAFAHFAQYWPQTAWVEVDEGLGISCRYENGLS